MQIYKSSFIRQYTCKHKPSKPLTNHIPEEMLHRYRCRACLWSMGFSMIFPGVWRSWRRHFSHGPPGSSKLERSHLHGHLPHRMAWTCVWLLEGDQFGNANSMEHRQEAKPGTDYWWCAPYAYIYIYIIHVNRCTYVNICNYMYINKTHTYIYTYIYISACV